MTRTSARLAELDRISRERSLTDDEQRAVLLLARRSREYANRRGTRRRPMSKSDAARLKQRDEQGRFA